MHGVRCRDNDTTFVLFNIRTANTVIDLNCEMRIVKVISVSLGR